MNETSATAGHWSPDFWPLAEESFPISAPLFFEQVGRLHLKADVGGGEKQAGKSIDGLRQG
ncbi:MAG: hypothetical protein U5N55_11195 [Cypionkella sp.]|nr:hypothetical protein [Cypionkella sp.]